ncbi:MAG: hypothetical protein K0S40_1452 [Actinomycetospora sp.]|nr:hypothetical protein [Actinomycetospora sp.]
MGGEHAVGAGWGRVSRVGHDTGGLVDRFGRAVPAAPVVRLRVDRADGGVPLLVDEVAVAVDRGADPHRAGLAVAARRARGLGRPVRVEMASPWSSWPLVVHPDGAVDDGRATPPAAPADRAWSGRRPVRAPALAGVARWPRRRPVGAVTVAGALAAVLVAGAVTTGVVTLAAPAAAPAACRDVTLFAVNGSGAAGGETLAAITDPLVQRVGERLAVVSVPGPEVGASYEVNQQQAVTALADQVAAQLVACPDGSAMLFGYSQGAHVAGDLAARVGGGQERRISADEVLAVGLFGDPARATGVRTVPDGVTGQGVLPAREGGFGTLANRTIEVCAPEDPVCATAGGATVPPLQEAVAAPAHTGYATLAVAPGTPAPRWASDSLGRLITALPAAGSPPTSSGSATPAPGTTAPVTTGSGATSQAPPGDEAYPDATGDGGRAGDPGPAATATPGATSTTAPGTGTGTGSGGTTTSPGTGAEAYPDGAYPDATGDNGRTGDPGAAATATPGSTPTTAPGTGTGSGGTTTTTPGTGTYPDTGSAPRATTDPGTGTGTGSGGATATTTPGTGADTYPDTGSASRATTAPGTGTGTTAGGATATTPPEEAPATGREGGTGEDEAGGDPTGTTTTPGRTTTTTTTTTTTPSDAGVDPDRTGIDEDTGAGDGAASRGSAGSDTGALWALTSGLAGFQESNGGNVEGGGLDPEEVESPNVPGRQAVKLEVPGGAKRSEVRPEEAQDIREGEHLFFGYSAFLPEDFPVDTSDWQVIWQLHDGGTNTSPPVALEVVDGRLWLANVGDRVRDLGPVEAGRNLDVQLDIRFEIGGGEVSVYRGGQQVLEGFRPPRGTMIDSFDYLKTGIYRHTEGPAEPATLFLNDLKIGDTLASVSDLAGAEQGAGAGAAAEAGTVDDPGASGPGAGGGTDASNTGAGTGTSTTARPRTAVVGVDGRSGG